MAARLVPLRPSAAQRGPGGCAAVGYPTAKGWGTPLSVFHRKTAGIAGATRCAPIRFPPRRPGPAVPDRFASTAARGLARELGLGDIEIIGSGRGGRVTLADVRNAAPQVPAGLADDGA